MNGSRISNEFYRSIKITPMAHCYCLVFWAIDFSCNGLSTENRLRSQRTSKQYKIKVNICKLIDWVIRIESTWAICIPRFSNFLRSLDRPFSHVFIFGNMCPESPGFVAMPVTRRIKDTCSNLSLSTEWRKTKLLDIVSGTATKPWLSGNILPNVKTCENGWSDFSKNFIIVVLKLLPLNRSLSPNQSIYSYLI